MATKQKGSKSIPTMLKGVCIVASTLLLCVTAAEDAKPSLRRMNITTSIANYNHCETKCMTSIEDGHPSSCLGFAGDDCSFPYEICPDSVTQCFGPMAVCVDDKNYESNSGYHCDCKIPSFMDPTSVMEDVLIQDCRDRITEVCEKDKTVSAYAFCTNGGECVDQVESGEPHPGCFCPGRFVGQHCEKRRGTGPEYRPELPNKLDEFNEDVILGNERRLLGPWMSILIFLLSSALAGFLIYAAVLYKKFLSQRNAPPLQDDNNSKSEMSIHVPPYGVNDNISALEMR